MLQRTQALALIAVLSATLPKALAAFVTPCAAGQGTDNGCGACDHSKSVAVTPFNQATPIRNFDMPAAAAQNGAGGWDVWWNIDDPGAGCRIIITQPFTTERGSVDPALTGNVIVSAAHAGCYYSHVDSGGVSAAFCCGAGDCAYAGAAPPLMKRQITAQKSKQDKRRKRLMLGTSSNPAKRWGGSAIHSDPGDPATSSAVTCSPGVPNGDRYTKSGHQQVNAQVLDCNGGETCSITVSVAVAVGTSLTNQQSTTVSQGGSLSVAVQAGYGIPLPGASYSVTITGTADWSTAVAKSLSTTDSNTRTMTIANTLSARPGIHYNAWFTPTLNCQSFTVNCSSKDYVIEKCEPIMNGDQAQGTIGLMVIG